MKKKVVAFILARGGSKRLPGKNIKSLNGIPLIHYVLKAATNADCLDEIIVSSDSDEILEIAGKINGVITWKRPDSLSSDQTTSLEVMKYLLNEYERKIGPVSSVVLLQPTSPFTTSSLINKAVHEFMIRKSNYLFSIVKSNIKAEWLGTLKNNQFCKILNSNIQDIQYRPSGNIYIYSKDFLVDEKVLVNTLPDVIEISEQEAIDIDSLLDFQFAEYMIKKSTT